MRAVFADYARITRVIHPAIYYIVGTKNVKIVLKLLNSELVLVLNLLKFIILHRVRVDY